MSEAVSFKAKEPIKSADNAPKLAFGLPVRNEVPVQFLMHMLQKLPPLNVKLSYIVRQGELPAAARNGILTRALAENIDFVIFFDDDVMFPDITPYRLWVMMQKHPEAACITGVYSTKLSPTEPLIYLDSGSGAYWDWPMGALIPIDGAGAGCMIVRMEAVRKLDPPWFTDKLKDNNSDAGGYVIRNFWGQDRYFHRRLNAESGMKVYADTGLLLGHLDVRTQKTYILPPDSPCYQRPAVGEAFVPYFDSRNVLMWRRIVTMDNNPNFRGYLDWLTEKTRNEPRVTLESVSTAKQEIKSDEPASEAADGPNDGSETQLDRLRRIAGIKSWGGD